jgi:hypothetical protein
MDIRKYLTPEFDFSNLDKDYLDTVDITFDDISEVITNNKSQVKSLHDWPPGDNRWYCVGFSKRVKCLFILFRFEEKFIIQDLKPANEDEIKTLWCQKRHRS